MGNKKATGCIKQRLFQHKYTQIEVVFYANVLIEFCI